jgi:pantoate--beta-alanine ligase
MRVATTIFELRNSLGELLTPIGLVPTMGYLHEGHLSLVSAAMNDCASVVVSIFLNPTQFSPEEDLSTYPRNMERDLEKLDKIGVDLVWTPTPDDMYPTNYQTWVKVERLTQPLEGKYRPGHFSGVTTVVTKLFNAVRPHKAYFGQKDAQQVIVIRQMVKDLNMDVDIQTCPTVRDPDGLAMSSRNTYLNRGQRRAAPILFTALQAARVVYDGGERSATKLRLLIHKIISSEPLANIQYISCADADTLEEIQDKINGRALLSLAVFFGSTRLIDNVLIGD